MSKTFFLVIACWVYGISGVSAQDSTLSIPSLDQMAGAWIPMKDVANPPAVHNFHDMLIVGYDLVSFACKPGYWLWHKKPDSIDLAKAAAATGRTNYLWNNTPHQIYPKVQLSINGKEYRAEECRWFPYKALRRNNNCDGFAVETDVRMLNEQNAVLTRIKITNYSGKERKLDLGIQVPGFHLRDESTILSPVTINQKAKYITASSCVQSPDNTDTSGGMVNWHWNRIVSPGKTIVIEYVSGHGDLLGSSEIAERVKAWSDSFQIVFNKCKQAWEERWNDAFTPGNKHFSGSLPILITDNKDLKRNYYMGIVTLLALERTQFAMHPRSFVANGERDPGTQYYWDAGMQATIWALLEPEGMKTTLKRWLVKNVRKGVVINLNDVHGIDTSYADRITGYAFTTSSFFQTTFNYLRITNDTAFMREKLENGKTVLERLDEIAMDWKTLVLPGNPLANYGENASLLECAPAYIHRVASANAQNILMMRETAQLYEFINDTNRARDLRNEANAFVPAIFSLYKKGDGVWYGLHKDGKRVELRHCIDYIYVGNALHNDLNPVMRKEMTQFVKNELLMPHWMRAMSLKDPAAEVSYRPDHGPLGAYDGWIPLTVQAMWRLGFGKDAFQFYCQTAEVTKEGPFVQAREFYGPGNKTKHAPVRVAYRFGSFKESMSGAAFSDVVVTTFFGFSPTVDGRQLICDGETARPFTGTLKGLRYNNQLFTLNASAKGVEVTKN